VFGSTLNVEAGQKNTLWFSVQFKAKEWGTFHFF